MEESYDDYEDESFESRIVRHHPDDALAASTTERVAEVGRLLVMLTPVHEIRQRLKKRYGLNRKSADSLIRYTTERELQAWHKAAPLRAIRIKQHVDMVIRDLHRACRDTNITAHRRPWAQLHKWAALRAKMEGLLSPDANVHVNIDGDNNTTGIGVLVVPQRAQSDEEWLEKARQTGRQSNEQLAQNTIPVRWVEQEDGIAAVLVEGDDDVA